MVVKIEHKLEKSDVVEVGYRAYVCHVNYC